MAEDPVTNLVKQHFQRVREYLQDKKNLDSLTRFSFRFTSDKAIDDTDFNTDDEFIYPDIDQSESTPGKCLQIDLKSLSETSIEQIESEEFQAETDFEADSTGGHSITASSSSQCNATDDNEERNDEQNQTILHHKPSRKTLLERPETPMLEMYNNEDESENDTTPRKMEGSQKFILSPEQFPAGDLNLSPTSKYINEDNTVDTSEKLEILPRRGKTVSRLQLTREENEKTFHKELEMYKKDIKLEKTIHSLSCETDIKNQPIITHPQSCSYDQCLKTLQHEGKAEIEENPKDILKASRLETSYGLDIPQKNISEYLKNLFEESSTNVCRKSPQYEQLKKQSDNNFYPKIGERQNTFYDEQKISQRNYLKMNHLEIQKEMKRRIEDMYKTGDAQ